METFDTVVPVEQSNIKVIQTLAEDIANGKCNVGVMITPQDFKNHKACKWGNPRGEILCSWKENSLTGH